jgi:hypothetical protein
MNTDIKTQIIQELPDLLENDPAMRQSVWRLVAPYFAPRQETDSRFDQMMAEIRQMREESERKWAENQAELQRMREESERKWEEQREESERKWAENQQHWEKNWAELQRMREESERKWAENQAELQRMREESERKWEEQRKESERKWAENQAELQRMREESERKWEEQRKESERKWAENQAELQRMREESDRKWEEQRQESERKWEQSERKWEETMQELHQLREEQKEASRKLFNDVKKYLDVQMGAIGARWGIRSEASFRNAMRGLLQEAVPHIQVKHVDIKDETGEVLGYPANIELDVVIHNGTLIVCEIKSSVSGGDVRDFHNKVQFYKKHHHPRQEMVSEVMISPMVSEDAKRAAQVFGVQFYSYMEDVFLAQEDEEDE